MVAALEDVDVQIHSSFHSFIKTLFIEHLLNVDTGCSTEDTTVNCADMLLALKLLIVQWRTETSKQTTTIWN